MKKRIISLCIILFILIMCATVNANEVQTTNLTATNSTTEINENTEITNVADIDLKSPSITDTTIQENIQQSEIASDSTSIDKQDVQTSNNGKIVKQNNSSNKLNVKTDAIKNSTGLNITGIVTTAYDKVNNKYAGDETEGFIAEGAKVNLYDNKTGELLKTTLSDEKGQYKFLNLTSGNYTLEFSYKTFLNDTQKINLYESIEFDYIFVPDLVIISFSGDSNGNGQSDKIKVLTEISDRFLFLESYELNKSYDNSGQWMIDYANFILVDMFSLGNGFGVDTDLIATSPASKKNKIAYTFGLFDDSIIRGTLAHWGFLGGNPHSIENTYIGSYWQVLSESNSTTIRKNMINMYAYIRYLLGETDVNPTMNGNGPLLLSCSWGLYYPGFENNVKTPDPELINRWIISNPGYNSDRAGSLNWMTEDYSKWNLENNDPVKILRTFEDWYTANVDINGSFIVISTYYEGGPVVDALIKEYEKQGRAVFSIYKTTSEDPDMTALLELAGNKTILTRGVSAVSYMYWWTTGYAQRGGNYTINAYKNLNVSLIDALKDISKFGFESIYGPQNEWTAAVTMPQFEGVFGALPVSYIDDNKETVVIPEGIQKHVQLTNGWAKLRELNNSDKKVSILVYGYPPGKANIGASFLDVFQSIHDMLERMVDEGYDLGMNKSEIPTTEELNNIITDFSNKGLWAEGLIDTYVITHYDELVKHGQLVSQTQYKQWYDELPAVLREHVTKSWGEGLGNGSMIYREKAEINKSAFEDWLNKNPGSKDQFEFYWNTTERPIIISEDSEKMLVNKTQFYKWVFDLPTDLQKVFNDSMGSQILNETNYRQEGYFLIPGKFFGNIFLSVQPMRGWESQMDFHTSDLSPPQQYIAYYKYLSQILKTDAIVHMGTHGTLEWLPGRTMGLQATDWPFQLTETPIIYPYIVSNPGEGMTAKERSFAQILTHMTPVTAASSLYGDYVELNDAISRYDTSKKNGVEDNVLYYRDLILNLTESLGYDTPDYKAVQKYLDDYEITLVNEDTEAMEEAKRKLIIKATILGFILPDDDRFEGELQKLKDYLSSEKAFEEWMAQIHNDLEMMSTDKINYGMHTLGKIWNDTELITGVTAIVASRTTVLDNIMKLYYPDIKESYYDKIKDRSFNDKKEIINGILKNMITNFVDGKSAQEVAAMYGIYDNTTEFYQDFVDIEDTINKILANKEWEYIFTALSGGYVEPGLSADPLYSDVLPTGRSMYASDTTKIPSKSAWQSAINSIDQVLIKYMVDLGEESFPDLVGEVIWGTEVLRTEGISLAQFMYLLGVKPVWDKTGTVVGAEVIPLEDLTLTINGTVYNRPRIDVFATIVSNNPGWIGLLTQSVEMVNALNESFNDNFVKKHYNESGSLERLFGLPGAVLEGTGVADMLNNAGTNLGNSSALAEELASVYEYRIGHSWNLDDDGNILVQNDTKAFSYLLEHLTLVIQNLDSSWRYLDSDDYVDWFGGLLNAANVHGRVVNTILLDIRDKNNIVTSTLGEEVKKETRTTILNPQWLGAMTTDVGGWNQMSQNFENLMKTLYTTQGYSESQSGRAVQVVEKGNNAGIVGDGLLKEVAKLVTYSEYFTMDAQYKSYAFQSMSGFLLTLDMNGNWKTNDNTLRKDMLQKYVDNANRYGVACCHHTCGNINFHEWIIRTGAALGVKGLSEYSKVYASATKNPSAVYSESSSSDNTGSTDGSSTVDISEGIGEYINNGATGEGDAMAMAAAGATGYADSTSAVGAAMVMTKVNNGGNGSGANSDAQSGNETSGGSEGSGTGSQNSTGNQTNGTGNGTGSDDNAGNESAVSGNGTSSNSTTNMTTNTTDVPTNTTPNGTATNVTNTTVPEAPDNSTDVPEDNSTNTTVPDNSTDVPETPTNSTDVPENTTNSTVEVPENTTDVPVENNTNTTEPEVPQNNTEVPEVPENNTNTTVPETQKNDTEVPTEQNNTQVPETPDKPVQNVTEETKESGAGETPSEGEVAESESSDSSTSESSESSSSDASSSSAGATITVGSSSSGGESGTAAGAVSMYEVVKKNIGKPPSPQAEISAGYLVFIVGLLGIFFYGFTRPNRRSK